MMSNTLKVLLGVLGGALLVLVLLPVFAGGGLFGSGSMLAHGGMMGQGGMMDGGWGILGILGGLVQLLFWGGLLAVIVWAVVRITANRQGGGTDARVGGDSAEEVLRQRFARGEIDAEEYDERRRILRKQSPAAHR
jgi:putative membrane protein